MADKNDMLYIMGRIHSLLEVARVSGMLTDEERHRLKRGIDTTAYRCVDWEE